MPVMPFPGCRNSTCAARAVRGGFCREHARQRDRQRGTRHQRGYDSEWEQLRTRHLEQHPFCVVCGVKATDVDHIVSVREAPHRRLDPTNMRSLCHSHHSRRTVIEGVLRRKRRGLRLAAAPTMRRCYS